METNAKLNYLRIAPRKVRLVTDFIKGMEVKDAENHLRFAPKRVSQPLLKLLKSAISNAENNFKLDKAALYVKQIIVNEGTPFKRWRPVSRGRVFPIMKRTSNISIILGVKPTTAKALAGKEGAKIRKIKKGKKVPTEEIKKEEAQKEGVVEKPKLRAPKEITKGSKIGGLTKKIFRRKSF